VIQRNTRSGKSLSIQILIRQKRNDLYAIAFVNKNLVNRTVSFENELVPLNGRIGKMAIRTHSHWHEYEYEYI